jgi:hypothetical protein
VADIHSRYHSIDSAYFNCAAICQVVQSLLGDVQSVIVVVDSEDEDRL